MGTESRTWRARGALLSVLPLTLLAALAPAASGATLEELPGVSLSGSVQVPDGYDAGDVTVRVVPAQDQSEEVAQADVEAAGEWQVADLPAGDYKVQFATGTEDLVAQWWQEADSFEEAEQISLEAGESVADISAELEANDLSPLPAPVEESPQSDGDTLSAETEESPEEDAAPSAEPRQKLARSSGTLTASASTKGSISGTVTVPPGQSASNVTVWAGNTDGNWWNEDVADNGKYRIDGLPGGTYTVEFAVYVGPKINMIYQWWKGKYDEDSATPLKLAAGENKTNVNATMVKGASIQGKVDVPSGQDPRSVRVRVHGVDNTYGGDVSANGEYLVDGLTPGTYKVEFSATNEGKSNMLSQWWKGKDDETSATPIKLAAEQTQTKVDASMKNAASISGKVTVPVGITDAALDVLLYDTSGELVANKFIDSYKPTRPFAYTLKGLKPGTYKLKFVPLSEKLAFAWWGGAFSEASASTVTIKAHEDKTGLNVSLGAAAKVTGKIGAASSGPIKVSNISAYRYENSKWSLVHTVTGWGNYTLKNLPAGTYKIGFDKPDKTERALQNQKYPYCAQYWNGKDSLASANQFTVKAGGTQKSVNATLYSQCLKKGSVTISGAPQVGFKLSAKPGTWTKGTKLTYEWFRDGKTIKGKTGSTYTLVAADQGKKISVKVTGSRTGYQKASNTSKLTSSIKAAAKPKIVGTVRVGAKLTVKPGTWTKGTKLSYQWYAGGKKISGATKSTYVLKKAQAGKTITVRVTGKNGSTSSTVTSAKTLKVTTAAKPKIVGTARVGAKLTAKPGTWTKGTKLSYQWYAGGKKISGATKSTYVLKKAQAGKTITVKTTGAPKGYAKVTMTSAKTKTVKK